MKAYCKVLPKTPSLSVTLTPNKSLPQHWLLLNRKSSHM